MEREYVAFISYRHKELDKAVAKWLHGLIEGYVIPKELRENGQKKFGIAFRDQEELAASSDLSQDIQEALDHSRYLIVICTPDTPSSIWVEKEIRHFLKHHCRQDIFIVLAAGESSQALPGILTRPVVDVTGEEKQIEPLAVDIRAKSKYKCLLKLRRECKRLFAAMLHCPYDALILREQRRKFLRFSVLAAMILTVASGFVVMLWVKNHQIERKNTELAWQKSQVQYRESELLTAKAQEALENEEYYDVIEITSSALAHDGDEDRPYYAQAEATLFETLNIFSSKEKRGIQKKTVLSQMTPISDFCMEENSEWAITIDEYGLVRCFDTNTGHEIWSTPIYGGGLLEGVSQEKSLDHLFLCGDQCRVIGYHEKRLTCCDMSTGERLWSRDLSCSAADYVFYNEDERTLVYVDFVEGAECILELISISEETGEIIQSIPFASSSASWKCKFAGVFATDPSIGGTFSENGRYFAGAYLEEIDSEHCRLNVFVADLQDGTADICFQQEFKGSYGETQITDLRFQDQDDFLLIAGQYADYMVAGWATKLDWKQEKPIWQIQTPVEAEWGFFGYGTDTFVEYWENEMLIARHTGIYCLSLETGELLYSAQLPKTIVALKRIDKHNFGFALLDGTYGCGWYNSFGIHLSTDEFIGVWASVGECERIEICGGGIVQRASYDDMLEISVSNIVNEGHLELVPKKENNSVILVHPIAVDQIAEKTLMQLPLAGVNQYRMPFHSCGEHTIVCGPFRVFGEEEQYFMIIDTVSHEVKQVCSHVSEEIYGSSTFFLPDASGYVFLSSEGSVILDVNGERKELAAGFRFSTGTDGQQIYVGDVVRTGSAYLKETGNVLTARCDEQFLTIWLNGINEERIALPSNQVPIYEDISRYCRELQVGANGYILSALYKGGSAPSAMDFAVYSEQERQWKELVGTAVFPNENASALSEIQPYWAAVDEEDNVRILNLTTGEEIAVFPLLLPCASVDDMVFILKDSCLLVMTKDGQILVYNVASGTVLFREKVDQSSGKLAAYTDEANQRLYIANGGDGFILEGLCVDLRSWIKLADVPDLLYVDTVAGEVYQARTDDAIAITRIPTTRELVDLGEKLIKENE